MITGKYLAAVITIVSTVAFSRLHGEEMFCVTSGNAGLTRGIVGVSLPKGKAKHGLKDQVTIRFTIEPLGLNWYQGDQEIIFRTDPPRALECGDPIVEIMRTSQYERASNYERLFAMRAGFEWLNRAALVGDPSAALIALEGVATAVGLPTHAGKLNGDRMPRGFSKDAYDSIVVRTGSCTIRGVRVTIPCTISASKDTALQAYITTGNPSGSRDAILLRTTIPIGAPLDTRGAVFGVVYEKAPEATARKVHSALLAAGLTRWRAGRRNEHDLSFLKAGTGHLHNCSFTDRGRGKVYKASRTIEYTPGLRFIALWIRDNVPECSQYALEEVQGTPSQRAIGVGLW
jgi:hypothetical protein